MQNCCEVNDNNINFDFINYTSYKNISSFYNLSELKICIYTRVSSNSLKKDNQVNDILLHYRNLMAPYPDWKIIDIITDEGTSKKDCRKIDGLLTMIDMCKKGKYNLIVTPSISHFSLSYSDTIFAIQELKYLNPPIGIFFDKEQIMSLLNSGEERLKIHFCLKELEREKRKSAVIKRNKPLKKAIEKNSAQGEKNED